MTCYMCGSPATRRFTLDLDIEGVRLCDKADCHAAITLFFLGPDEDEKLLLKWRRSLHKSRGNKMPKP